MRILTELIGGVVLLLIFFYGIRKTVDFFEETDHEHVSHRQPDDAAPPDDTTRKPH